MIKRIDKPSWQSSITNEVYDTEVDAWEAECAEEDRHLKTHGLDKYIWTARQAANDDEAVSAFRRRENHIYRALASNRALSIGCEYASNGNTLARVIDGKLELVMLINFGDMPPSMYRELEQFMGTFYSGFITAYRTSYMGVLTGLMAIYSPCRRDLNPGYAPPLIHVEKALFGYQEQLSVFMKEYGLQA